MGLMNFNDQLKVDDTLLREHWGEVLVNLDPEGRQRIKVSIQGILEGSPDDLPWVARSGQLINGQSQEIPEVGSLVKVSFIGGDIYSPVYGGKLYTQKPTEEFKTYFPSPSAYGRMDSKGNVDSMSLEVGKYLRAPVSTCATRIMETKGVIQSGCGSFDITFNSGKVNFLVGGLSINTYPFKDEANVEEDPDMKDLPGSGIAKDGTDRLSGVSKNIRKFTQGILALIETIPETPAEWAGVAKDQLPEDVRKQQEANLEKLNKVVKDKVDNLYKKITDKLPPELQQVKKVVDILLTLYDLVANFDPTKVAEFVLNFAKNVLSLMLFNIKPYVDCYNATVTMINDITRSYQAITYALEEKYANNGGSYTSVPLVFPELPPLPDLPEA